MSMRSFRLKCEGVSALAAAAAAVQFWSFDASLDFLSPSFGGYECFLDIVSFLLSSALIQN